MSNIQPVPAGFHTATPYMVVPDAAAALDFYSRAFGAVIGEKMTRPDGVIMHASFRIGDSLFMIGSHAGVQPRDPQLFPMLSIYLYVDDADATFARAVEAGATVLNPVAQKFYGNREGGLADPCGIIWWIATQVEVVSKDEMERRAAAAMPGS